MLIFHFIYLVAVQVERIVCFIAPKTFLAEWFFWFTGDAKALLLVARKLELTRSYQKVEHPDMLIDFTVYHAALAFGKREYYGMYARWPLWFVRHLHHIGMQLDATQWQEGCQNGYKEVELLETSAASNC